jgi:hypothetical protein
MTLQTVLTFLSALPAKAGTPLFWWFLATAVVNLVAKDPAKDEALLEEWPAYAHFATMLRKWGVDPVAGWKSLVALAATLLAKDAPPGAPPMADKKEDSDGPR